MKIFDKLKFIVRQRVYCDSTYLAQHKNVTPLKRRHIFMLGKKTMARFTNQNTKHHYRIQY